MSSCPLAGVSCEKIARMKPRSLEHLRRYFAVIRAAYMHWPEHHERQFSSETECRIWLQMQAGAREVGGVLPLAGIKKQHALMLGEMFIRSAGAHAHIEIDGTTITVWRPKSISFAKMKQDDFTALSNAVEDVIAAEIGITADELLQHGEAA